MTPTDNILLTMTEPTNGIKRTNSASIIESAVQGAKTALSCVAVIRLTLKILFLVARWSLSNSADPI